MFLQRTFSRKMDRLSYHNLEKSPFYEEGSLRHCFPEKVHLSYVILKTESPKNVFPNEKKLGINVFPIEKNSELMFFLKKKNRS